VTARRDLLWMQFLVGKGANVNIARQQGRDAAGDRGQPRFPGRVDFLISVGARVDDPNNTGETPLITAVHGRNIALVRRCSRPAPTPTGPTIRAVRRAIMPRSIMNRRFPTNWKRRGQEAPEGKAAQTYGPTF
jgi:hypothetical protein